MSSQLTQRKELTRLYESALEIVEDRNLYNIKIKIKKHSDNSFNEYVKQNLNTDVYHHWWIDLQENFAKVNLNFLKFKKNILFRESFDEFEISPPGYLHLAINEIEKILSDKQYLNGYMLSSKAIQTWPLIKYKNGIVNNGEAIHDFNKFENTDAILMFNRLWEGREVRSPTHNELRKAVPSSWIDAGFKNADSGKSTANAINKAMREKHIKLRIKYPRTKNGVFIRLQQKSTE